MRIANLTPHAINYHGADNWIEQFPPDGRVARVEMREQETFDGAMGVQCKIRPTPKGTIGLPAPVEGVYWIVSSMVREANPFRLDLLSPADLVRDEKGNVIGCKAFDTNYLSPLVQYGGHGI